RSFVASYRRYACGLRRFPYQQPSTPITVFPREFPQEAWMMKFTPPYVCVCNPSCVIAKMISGEVLLSAWNMCRKLGSMLYAPEAITALAAVTACAYAGVPVSTAAFRE